VRDAIHHARAQHEGEMYYVHVVLHVDSFFYLSIEILAGTRQMPGNRMIDYRWMD
jgi:hypothetical protein